MGRKIVRSMLPFKSLTIAFILPACLAAQPKLRLSEVQDAAPVRYRATLDLDPAKESFSGVIDIQVAVRKPVATLWLNATKINVKEASVTAAGKSRKAV